MADQELTLSDLADSIASISLGSKPPPAAAVTEAEFVPAASAGTSRAQVQSRTSQPQPAWEQKQQIARHADAGAKAWSEFKQATGQGNRPDGGGVFGSKKLSFKLAAKPKKSGAKQHTHTASPLPEDGRSTQHPNRSWSEFRQPTLGGWDDAVGPCLRVVSSGDPSLAVGIELRVPRAATTDGAGFVAIGRKAPTSSAGTKAPFIAIKEREASSIHAQLGVSADGSLWLTDAGSNNGTLLNGQRLSASRQWSQPVALATGDVVRIGGTELSAWVPKADPMPGAALALAAAPEPEPEPELPQPPTPPSHPPPPPPPPPSQPQPEAEPEPESEPELAVLDTCILLDERELTALTRLVSRRGCGKLQLVLPMVVLQELDGLKKNVDPELARRARRAVGFIHDAFAAGAPWMVGQR